MSGYRRKASAIHTIDIRIQKRSIGYTDSIWLKNICIGNIVSIRIQKHRHAARIRRTQRNIENTVNAGYRCEA